MVRYRHRREKYRAEIAQDESGSREMKIDSIHAPLEYQHQIHTHILQDLADARHYPSEQVRQQASNLQFQHLGPFRAQEPIPVRVTLSPSDFVLFNGWSMDCLPSTMHLSHPIIPNTPMQMTSCIDSKLSKLARCATMWSGSLFRRDSRNVCAPHAGQASRIYLKLSSPHTLHSTLACHLVPHPEPPERSARLG